jgi:ketol-acid reductoisomerase
MKTKVEQKSFEPDRISCLEMKVNTLGRVVAFVNYPNVIENKDIVLCLEHDCVDHNLHKYSMFYNLSTARFLKIGNSFTIHSFDVEPLKDGEEVTVTFSV